MNLTFTYKFSAFAPEAHAAVSGWGEHHLIIGNNLQAGWEWRAMGWRTAFLAGAPSIIGAAQQPTFQLYSSILFRTPPPLVPFEKVKINEVKEKSYFFAVMCTQRTPLPCWCEHAKSFQLTLYKKNPTSITSNKHLFCIMIHFKTTNLQKLTVLWPLTGVKFLNVMNVDVSHLISSVQSGGLLCFGQFCNLSLSPRL